MSKQEGNADWVARDAGRIPSKGAKAAERASAGLGTTGADDPAGEPRTWLAAVSRRRDIRATAPGKPAPGA